MSAASRDRLIDLLRLGKRPSLGARLRIAIDVLGQLGEADTVVPRSEAGPTLEAVVLDVEGRARLTAIGDLTGAAVLVWEILALTGAPLEPPSLRDVVKDVRPNVDDLVQRALSPTAGPTTPTELACQLVLVGESFIASRATVAAQLLSASGARSKKLVSRSSFGETRSQRSTPSPGFSPFASCATAISAGRRVTRSRGGCERRTPMSLSRRSCCSRRQATPTPASLGWTPERMLA